MVSSSVPADEKELAQRASAGDVDAFTEIVRRYRGPIFRLCLRYLPAADAEDAAQDTFVRAFVHRRSFDPERPLLPWLLTIARRLCLDRIRKMKPELTDDLDRYPHEGPAGGAEAAVAAAQELSLVRRGLAGLPEGQREAILLFHQEGLSYQEIATSLDRPVGTVMTWLFRGRAFLRKLVADAREPTEVFSAGTRGGKS